MLIDWFTVFAQIVNFLILVGLLKYFLYGRVIAAMEKRQREIAGLWEEAEETRIVAAKEARDIERKNQQLSEEREARLAQVQEEVASQKQDIIARARAEVTKLQTRWKESLQEETDSFLRDLRRVAAEKICETARRALKDLADEDLEETIARTLLRRIASLDAEERKKLASQFQQEQNELVVRSAFQLSPALQEEIASALRERLFHQLSLRFEESPELICGVALHSTSHKISWELRDYLDSLEEEMRKILVEQTMETQK